MTADRFVPDPWSATAGARMYRTGDRCRRLADGSIEFLGRTDHQVKIRDFRIEPGEIQTVLARHEKVSEAVVVPRSAAGGEQRLVAYVVPDGDAPPTIDELRTFLSDQLPEPLVPSAFAVIEALPRTTHGKMDLKALPEPETTRPRIGTDYAAPRDAVERRLCAIWADVLGVDQVGIHDNFFELGGHSLLATQLMSRVHDAFQVRLPLRELFDASTVAAMAQVVHRASRGPQLPPIERAGRDRPLELSLAQERLWFLDQMNPGGASYNMPAAVRLTGVLDLRALEEAFAEVARRHEILRTSFPSVDGKPVQRIGEERRPELRLVELDAAVAGDEPLAFVRRLARQEAQRPFDIAAGPLLRLTLLRLTPGDHVLLVTMHHIISDGWSMGVFVREFVEAYDAFAAGHRPVLPPLAVQYADYAQWQRGWLSGDAMNRELGYWKRKLEHLPVLELETDRPRPEVQTFRGRLLRFDLSGETSTAVRQLSNRRQATPFMTLLAAFDVVLHHRTGQVDLGVGTDVANRDTTETEGLIGFFTNQIVLRTNLSGDPTFDELIARVKETSLEAFAHQEVPFDRVVAALRPKRRLDRAPLVDVKLVLQNAPLPAAQLGDLQVELLDPEIETSKFDLLVNIRDDGERFAGEVTYNTDLFDAERVARILEQFSTVLDMAVARPESSLSALVAKLASQEREATKTHRVRRKATNIEKLRRLRRPRGGAEPSVGES
jgi:acyl carrier protein